MSDPKTISILLRLRRITIEDGYVAVPLTSITDPDALTREGLRLASDPRIEWQVEERNVECHPIQKPRPEDRAVLDPFLDDDTPVA